MQQVNATRWRVISLRLAPKSVQSKPELFNAMVIQEKVIEWAEFQRT